MRPVLVTALAATALVAACFNPQSGDYVFEGDGEPATDCPESDTGATVEFEDSTDEVEVADDKESFTIGGDLECELDGRDFDCDMGDFETDSTMTGLDATIPYTAGMDGSWTSSTSMEGTFSFESSCSGEDCGYLEEFGAVFCGIDADWTAELDE